MNSEKHLEWLEKNNLQTKTKRLVPSLKEIYTHCLGADKENILIITDHGRKDYHIAPTLAGGYILAARELELNTNVIVQPVKRYNEPVDPRIIKNFIAMEKKGIIIICVSNKLGEIKKISKSFRGFVKEMQHRFISATSLGTINNTFLDTIIDAIVIDYTKLRKRQEKIKKIFDNGNILHIKTNAGTDLEIDIEGKLAISNDGNYTTKGSGGNIPCGEVYIPPSGKTGVNGRVVIDTSSRNAMGTTLVKHPITLDIKDGRVIGIKGDAAARLLEKTLVEAEKKAKYPKNVRLIGELGIGMNPNARIIGSMIVDEKVAGTAHIAIGSNNWFGGDIKTIVHLDQVFRNPEIMVDGKRLKVE